MSATKRSRQRPAGALLARSPSQPASKRIKSSHVPVRSGLDFLVDEDARATKTLGAKLTNGTPRAPSARVNEAQAVIAHNNDEASSDSDEDEDQDEHKHTAVEHDIIDISSGEDESSELDEDEDEEEEEAGSIAQHPSKGSITLQSATNGHTSDQRRTAEKAEKAEKAETEAQADDDGGEPTFGDLLRARHLEPVDLQKSLQIADPASRGLVPVSGEHGIPTGHTLGTLLSQALKSNDKDMLEACLAMNDQNSIRATIQRQTPREVALLMEKIAERVHRRPGRAGNLMTWVQWSLVCHGGYMAHQPELMSKLRSLAQVLRQRANGLQPLLHLKGKLDLLAAQLELRRGMQQASQAANMENLDEEKGVIYIEGQDDDWSENDEATGLQPRKSGGSRRKDRMSIHGDDEDDAEDEDVEPAMLNGTTHVEENESSAGEDEDDEEMVNGVLGAESPDDSDIEDSEVEDDEAESEVSSAEDDSSDEEESESENVKQAKHSILSRKR